MKTSVCAATGARLTNMRKAAGMNIKEALEKANHIAVAVGSAVRFSERSMRRFEAIGIRDTYGTTPPTLEELSILMRTYNGSPGYLLFGISPVSFPVDQFPKYKEIFFADEMVEIMSTIASWPEDRRQEFYRFWYSFVSR